jgi:hypothetical protein
MKCPIPVLKDHVLIGTKYTEMLFTISYLKQTAFVMYILF